MFGLELLSVGLLHFAALEVNPLTDQIECDSKKPLSIHVVPAQNAVRYDFSKKTAELNHIGKDAYSAYGEGHFNTETRGLTVGKQFLNHQIEFYFEKYNDDKNDGKLACLQIQKVKITMNYAPTIYISSKFKKGTPIFDKILEHEKEHVKITQRTLKKYKKILEDQLKHELQNQFKTGLFPVDDMQREQQKLQNRVKRITARVSRKMHEEAQRQHNKFDDSELNDTIKYNQSIAPKLEKILKLNE